MPTATAKDLRRRVTVTLPQSDLVIECRRPDLLSQVAHGVLTQTLVQSALQTLNKGFDLQTAAPGELEAYASFIDKWVCLAAVAPRIVAEEQDATDDAVWIGELQMPEKMAIVTATIGAAPAVAPAVEEFREGEPAGAAAGSGSAAVRH